MKKTMDYLLSYYHCEDEIEYFRKIADSIVKGKKNHAKEMFMNLNDYNKKAFLKIVILPQEISEFPKLDYADKCIFIDLLDLSKTE